MGIVFTILAALLTIFLDSFFVAVANFRILPMLSIAFYDKVNWKHLLVFLTISSLALDVIYHFVLGTNLLILVIILFLGRVASLIIPWGQNLGSYILKYLGFLIYYVLLALVPPLIASGTLGELTWGVVGGAFVKSAFALIFCILIDILWDRVRKRDDSTKLKLG